MSMRALHTTESGADEPLYLQSNEGEGDLLRTEPARRAVVTLG